MTAAAPDETAVEPGPPDRRPGSVAESDVTVAG
jgi:hypothetical protein